MDTYYAVIFTSQSTEKDEAGYDSMSARIEELVREIPGFIRLEGMRNPEDRVLQFHIGNLKRYSSLENV
ncbi:antibiotic biosynthesis monooxygenase family protein [Lysinibacillus sp. NPDC096418]|uniref:antibiotic biosynthesis monooxygenase family protein n=1 Tax=Lysinibacillus sp. NPDC096418 TaxID=3364138 RepID=UPI0037F5CCE0